MLQFVHHQKSKGIGFGKILIGTLATGFTAMLLVITYQAAQTETPGRSRAAPKTVSTAIEWGFDTDVSNWIASGFVTSLENGTYRMSRSGPEGIATFQYDAPLNIPSGIKYIQLRMSTVIVHSVGNKKTFGSFDASSNSKNIVVRYQQTGRNGWQLPLLLRTVADGGMRLYEVRMPSSDQMELTKLQFDFSDLGKGSTVIIDEIKILVDQASLH